MGNYSFSRFCISRLIMSLSALPAAVSEPVLVVAAALVEVEVGVAA
jgi:hypothetical protein